MDEQAFPIMTLEMKRLSTLLWVVMALAAQSGHSDALPLATGVRLNAAGNAAASNHITELMSPRVFRLGARFNF